MTKMPATLATNHLPELLLTMLEMVKKGEHCNCVMHCQDGIVRVPGLILGSISPLIKQLGSQTYSDTDFNIILPDYPAGDVMTFVYQLLTPSLTKDYDDNFHHIMSFFQSGAIVQEPFDSLSIRDLPTSLEDIDQVISAVSQEEENLENQLPLFEEDEGVVFFSVIVILGPNAQVC